MSNIVKNAAAYLLAAAAVGWVAAVVGNYFNPLNPAADRTSEYDRRVHFSTQFPFIHPYYLHIPAGYDGVRPYPLVLVLHGGFKRSGAAIALATPEVQADYPALVLMPMAPFWDLWALPDEFADKGNATGLPLAMEVVEKVQSRHAVDPDRIYVVGSSNGGFGTFGAVRNYPNVFAAAVPVAGGWVAREADMFLDVPIWAFHSADDPQISVRFSRDVMTRIRMRNEEARYTEFTDAGHASWKRAFGSRKTWDWLFSQSR